MLLPETERALIHRLATAQREGRAPSMAAAAERGGERVWSHAIETTTDTQFRIGSLTKTFVAVLVMRLRDEGRLRLDDPLEQHLTDVPVRNVTIAQLLSHTAGLASETPGPWWERTPGDLRPELADIVGDDPMKHPAGSRFHYSNPGFGLLGGVVEQLRGEPWPEVLQREVLDPLEMPRTSFLPREPYARGTAVHPWADVVMPEEVHETGRMAPAGQLWSTVEDLCRFANLVAGEGSIHARVREFTDWTRSFGATVVFIANDSGEVVEAIKPHAAEVFRFEVKEVADRATRFIVFEKSTVIPDQSIEVDPSRGGGCLCPRGRRGDFGDAFEASAMSGPRSATARRLSLRQSHLVGYWNIAQDHLLSVWTPRFESSPCPSKTGRIPVVLASARPTF